MSVSEHHGSVAGYEIYNELLGSNGIFRANNVGGFKAVFTVHTYNIMMHAFYRDGLLENLHPGEVHKAEEFFKEMRLNGEESTCVTYERLLNGNCKIGDLDSAMLLFIDMRRKRLMPIGCTFNVLIKELCEKNEVFEALKVSRVAMKRNYLAIKGESYEFLIKGL
ncbi:hypothetical protein L6452_00930 [Arctium lappa]|uniref:Uncharacterized protein n=1 Tax=Arctium lappa TaxID=4217 RepID=A0ACB9FF86_ARCLA|nr:hypothetical protein L6452_00930 [Arctium lappa]